MPATDKVALVTGAGRGIGRAIAHTLAEEGYRVALVARTAPELDEVVREIESDGGEALALPTDLADAQAAALAVRHTVERWGRLDVLVNNAGIGEEHAFSDIQFDELDRVLAVTLRATLVTTRAALPYLLERGEGAAVVNIASIAGRRAVKGAGVYTAAKHGVVGFGESLFEEIRERGIKVASILPGFVDTTAAEGTDEQRAKMIAPEDVAQAVQFVLASSSRVCPSEIVLRPQRSPYRGDAG